MAGIYIHIPFCKQACYYCDFHFSTSTDNRKKMVESLCYELILQKDYLQNQKIDTIYFGGGTPSMLAALEIENILNTVSIYFSISNHPEITLEANPDDLSLEKLSALKTIGINRLSIGIQSFDDEILKFLHRAHDSKSAIKSFSDARSCGFENISLDLIYSIPNQSDEQWAKNIQTALSLDSEHLSAYSLTIEEKTVFGQWRKKKKLQEVDEQIAAGQLELLIDKSTAAGLEHYEVSNFCKENYYSRHNSSYWKQTHYLGIGPGAHSYNGDTRQSNISNNPLYIKAIEGSKIPFELEVLTGENKINEYIFTTLRTKWGCNLDLLRTECQFDLEKEHGQLLQYLIANGMVVKNDSLIKLTSKGMLLADKISSDLFIES
jgi:oxygen-independent coproporphyrinogen-3 oxidase